MIREKMNEAALSYLSEGNCSEKQLYSRLKSEFSQTAELENNLKVTITRLRQSGLVNDNRIAYRIAERFSHKGNQFISRALKEQGIDDKLISATLECLGDEYYRAFSEAQTKIRDCQIDSIEDAATTVMRFLCSRHFSFITVKKVINNLFKKNLFDRCSQLERHFFHG